MAANSRAWACEVCRRAATATWRSSSSPRPANHSRPPDENTELHPPNNYPHPNNRRRRDPHFRQSRQATIMSPKPKWEDHRPQPDKLFAARSAAPEPRTHPPPKHNSQAADSNQRDSTRQQRKGTHPPPEGTSATHPQQPHHPVKIQAHTPPPHTRPQPSLYPTNPRVWTTPCNCET